MADIPFASLPIGPQGDSDGSYSFAADRVAQTWSLDLESLNAHPASHAEALRQLATAKKYIARVQQAAASSPNAVANGKINSAGYGSSAESDRRTLRLDSVAVSDADAEEEDEEEESVEMSPAQYYATPWWRLLLKRLPWLVSLLLLQSFGALILNHYETLLEKHLVLNFFIPMMQGTCGNAGNQPGVMVTRALGMGQMHFGALILKESPVALLTGLTLATVAYLRIRLVYWEDGGSALAIALTMFVAIVLAVALSIAFSYALHRITCCDPADGAVPLLSTVSDVLSILMLMAIAQKLLPRPIDQ